MEAWGIGTQNPLGLGPFINMESKSGVSPDNLLRDTNSGTRLIREDLSDDEIKTIYKQLDNSQLQLFKIGFDRIGSLSSPNPELRFPVRPLTWKTHDIFQTGGIDTFGTLLGA